MFATLRFQICKKEQILKMESFCLHRSEFFGLLNMLFSLYFHWQETIILTLCFVNSMLRAINIFFSFVYFNFFFCELAFGMCQEISY